MSLPNLSVRRPTAVSMFFIGIILIGIIAFRLLPVEMMPNTSFGDITINIDVRGGIPASEVEKRISIPVEEAVGTVSHLKNVLAISKEGNSTTILEFEPGTNMDFASLEVREKFNRIRNKLPPEIEKPVIAKYEYMDVPIMILAVTSDIRTPEQLRKIVDEKIRDRIQRIEGVARAEVAGGREGKIIIEIDQRKLQAYGIPINRVVDIINLNNSNLLAGEIKRTRDKYLIRTIGEFENLNDIKQLAIATTKEGSVIRVGDIADVKDSFLDPSGLARMNAEPVVSIYVQKESMANTVKISTMIDKEVKAFKKTLDKDIKVTPTFNQAEAIQQAINQVQSALVYGALLATLVLFLFLRDLRSVLIIASSIPLSLLITFCLMFFSKFTINVMTLSGLALGVGMLVDNAIVVLDNTYKKRDKAAREGAPIHPIGSGASPGDLAISAADEMLLAISASTLTTIIVFVPLVFINPEIRMLYSGIALTITYSLLASLLVALTLVPMLAARMTMKIPAPGDVPQGDVPQGDGPPGVSLEGTSPQGASPAMQGFMEKRASFTAAMQDWYKNLIGKCINLRYPIIIVALSLFAVTLQQSRKLEREFIGIAEQNKFTIFIELPTGTKLEVSDRIVKQVEQIVSKVPEIKTSTAKIEPWSSKIYAELVPLSKRTKSVSQIIATLRPHTEKLEPAFIYYEEPEEVGTKEILIEIYGYDYEVLKNLAIQVAQRIQGIPKFTDTKIRMREGRPEMRLTIDKRQAAMFGLSVEDIALALHTHMRGLVATRYRGTTEPIIRAKEESTTTSRRSTADQEQEIIKTQRKEAQQIKTQGSPGGVESKETETIVRLEEKFRRTFEDLRRISLVTPDGNQVYMSQLADFKFDLGPSEIWRKNKSRMVQVSANTGGVALGTAADKVKEALKEMQFPKDYFWQFGGNYDKMIRTQGELNFALILSLTLVYMLLACLFESFSEPFIILFSVPLALIGAVAALRLTHKPVGTGVLIGGIMLGGIVVNNAIVLIDRINFLRKKFYGSDHRTSVIMASADRLRPILMTSLTTILGLIPMALDRSESSNLWSPLAITVIGGLLVSKFLTLLIIPCVYFMFKDLRLVRK